VKPEIILPPLLPRFVESMNRQDTPAFVSCFADAAITALAAILIRSPLHRATPGEEAAEQSSKAKEWEKDSAMSPTGGGPRILTVR
jgi:hypothetical protein